MLRSLRCFAHVSIPCCASWGPLACIGSLGCCWSASKKAGQLALRSARISAIIALKPLDVLMADEISFSRPRPSLLSTPLHRPLVRDIFLFQAAKVAVDEVQQLMQGHFGEGQFLMESGASLSMPVVLQDRPSSDQSLDVPRPELTAHWALNPNHPPVL